jgi:hypothetical protein
MRASALVANDKIKGYQLNGQKGAKQRSIDKVDFPERALLERATDFHRLDDGHR